MRSKRGERQAPSLLSKLEIKKSIYEYLVNSIIKVWQENGVLDFDMNKENVIMYIHKY